MKGPAWIETLSEWENLNMKPEIKCEPSKLIVGIAAKTIFERKKFELDPNILTVHTF